MLLGFAAQHQQTTACSPPCATAQVSTLSTSTRPAPHLRTHSSSWKTLERTKIAKRNPRRYELIQSGTFDTIHHLHRPLSWPSFQDALRSFFQPIKTDDSRLDFYTMYKREATEFDTEYVKKYDEDLNTTLIFVRLLSFTLVASLTHSRRPDCSLPSAQRSSSTSIPSSSPTRTSNQQPSSAPSSSLSIIPQSRASPPSFRSLRNPRRAGSSL